MGAYSKAKAAAGMVLAAVILSGCGATHTNQSFAFNVGDTKLALTPHYMVVFNVVPPEEMYRPAQAAKLHPTEGEYILKGYMEPIHPDSRHFEAHIYSRATGLPVKGLTPHIVVTDTDTGHASTVFPTWMQDVVVGPRDFHYGNNLDMPARHHYRLQVSIAAGERASTSVYLQ